MVLTYHGYWRYSHGPKRWKLVHRDMMEKLLGRPLEKDEEVHHMDFDRQHNCYCNFLLLKPGRAWQRAQHVNALTHRDEGGRFARSAGTTQDALHGDDVPDWVCEQEQDMGQEQEQAPDEWTE